MQTMIVAVLVSGCAAYAVWKLMPSGLRRALAMAALKWPLPDYVLERMRPAATASTGCGCDGCDRAPKPAAPAAQVITFHPRSRR